jgi:hypothetical protein
MHFFIELGRFQPMSWLEGRSAITSANALLIPIPNWTSKRSLSRTARVITKPWAELIKAWGSSWTSLQSRDRRENDHWWDMIQERFIHGSVSWIVSQEVGI